MSGRYRIVAGVKNIKENMVINATTPIIFNKSKSVFFSAFISVCLHLTLVSIIIRINYERVRVKNTLASRSLGLTIERFIYYIEAI